MARGLLRDDMLEVAGSLFCPVVIDDVVVAVGLGLGLSLGLPSVAILLIISLADDGP